MRFLFYFDIFSLLSSFRLQTRITFITINVFAFYNVYSKIDNLLMNESNNKQFDFNINSNAFDANLLKLKQELKQLRSKKT